MKYGKPNHVPVFLLVFLDMMIAILWYSPMFFSEHWMDLNGESLSTLSTTHEWVFIMPIMGAVALNYTIDWLFRHLNITKIGRGMALSFAIWAGFYFFHMSSQYLMAMRKPGLIAIEAGVYLLMFLLAGFVLATWRTGGRVSESGS